MLIGLDIPDSEFPELYSWVEYFMDNYDNAENEALILLHGIVQAFIEKKVREHKVISEEEALAFLKVRNPNPRNAGRKPKFDEEQKAQMISLLESEVDKKSIAMQFNCSVSYVEKLWRRHRYD